ncbi:2-C-methyl-D-erythritol 4-phosphate cytidylyltransferase [Candidatus Izemoplasma sp. B36]|uniref:2-C-methyl-D-erythritol 4-phosphate cytidylyltransferase n=1 Tax=Candidatus Izemoplasma sp. B36 TaxID=3242468 RepID=UPI00355658B3
MYSALIVAAGSAQRTGLGYNKIFYKIKDKTLLEHTIENFIKDSDFKEIVIVLSKDDLSKVKSIFKNDKIKYVIGGSTRQKSVFNGLNLINTKYVFIHDGARPNIKQTEIAKLKQVARNADAVVLYTKAKDSVVKYEEDNIKEYVDRNEIGLIQTPQVFKSDLIKKAHSLAINNNNTYTDDASLFIKELNKKVALVEGQELNIKATTKYDLTLLEEIL